MYSTCLFCHSELGANEAVEHFPVGRRLAFDAAKGRLWVVCRKCERWNLTPIEERWEAIEECERSFRETKLRVSTDEIGMARLGEGLELVRIGEPLRPEFAAWRYGDQFGRRRRNTIIKGTAMVAAAAAVPFVGPLLAASAGGTTMLMPQIWNLGYAMYQRTIIVARVPDKTGSLLYVRAPDVAQTVMLTPTADQPWGLRISHRAKRLSGAAWLRYAPDTLKADIRGEEAIRLAAQLLPRLNKRGASRKELAQALVLATEHADPSIAFEKAARLAATKRSWNEFGKGALLSLVPNELRLALEIASHEESERRALEGELYLLEDAWREAEEIAAISDDMFLPTEVSESLAEIKSRVEKEAR
ncbi:MAG: hypothetical protein ABI408_07400 [Gemmatimonadaceae bacterium]